jgi:hypothetical protein
VLPDKCVILSADSGSYISRSGNEVNYTNINYFDVSDKSDTKYWRGYIPLKMNVYPDFNLSDLSSVPGCYHLTFRPAPSRTKGKTEPKLTDINFVNPFSLSESQNCLLVLGAKAYNFEDQKSRKTIKGVKFFSVDPSSYYDDSSFIGYPILENNIKGSLDQFPTVPGYYNIEFEQIRGRDGQALYVPRMVKFEAPFVPNQSQSQS